MPLVVDLDGTVVRTDTLHESMLQVIAAHPLRALRSLLELRHGRARFKAAMSQASAGALPTLPLSNDFLTWLLKQRSEGRSIVLATASDAAVAQAIAADLQIFDEVLASDGATNLKGSAKATALVARFGPAGFDYAGNGRADIPVFAAANAAIVVNGSPALVQRARAVARVEQVFERPRRGIGTWVRLFRLHQWAKNVLVFVPLLAAHSFDFATIWAAFAAFLAMSLTASAVYVINDLMDLGSDRQHERKRHRPLASGVVPLAIGAATVPLLLTSGWALGLAVGGTFPLWLAGYLTVTTAYTFGLKRVVLIDCLTLAGLYTLRIIAGGAATAVPVSFWMLAFSVFIFLSLAFIKRYAELQLHQDAGVDRAHGRGYETRDLPLVQAFGIAAGFAAVLVLALYLDSPAVMAVYALPAAVWGTVPVLLYWITWMWLQAHRGQMHDDPVVFAVRQRTSLVAGALFGSILFVGTVGWPW